MTQQSQSRDADKFVARMPEGMRGRLQDYALSHSLSMNTVVIHACDSFMDKHVELDAILAGVRLHLTALEQERAEVARLRAELDTRLAALGGADASPAESVDARKSAA